MSIEMITASGALIISFGAAILNFFKLRDAQKTWVHEQKILMDKNLLFRRLDKRYALYKKTFTLLGSVRDIEYPKHHHIDIKDNKQQLYKIADGLLAELYGEAGLFMEYETRTQILKTYQTCYKYIDDIVDINELIDSFYHSRRLLRKDLDFDDSSTSITSEDILKDNETMEQDMKQKLKKVFWSKNNILARSSRPGYPNKSVPMDQVNKTVSEWKDRGIKSVICLLSDEEISTYYKSINYDLVKFYKDNDLNVFHLSIEDYLSPAVSDENLTIIAEQYTKLKKPILIHCGAGQDRTGITCQFIINKFNL